MTESVDQAKPTSEGELPKDLAALRPVLAALRAEVSVAGDHPMTPTPLPGVDSPETADLQDARTVVIATLLSPPQEPGELGRLGDFRVLQLLGKGGMGVVFAAEDTRLDRTVALKVMLPILAQDPVARERFTREAKAAACVEHDYIVPIFQVGEANGAPYLTMPLLPGETLDSWLRRADSPAIEVILPIAKQIIDGLAAAHDAGLVHRDIKPSNIWLETNKDGSFRRVRILDFGLARSSRQAEGLTGSGIAMGTPGYLAPEQARGKPVDLRADLFSFGVMLYEMTTNQRPFTGSEKMAILTSVILDQPPPAALVNPLVPQRLSNLIERLLSKDPAGRPSSAHEVSTELAEMMASLTTVAPSPATEPVPSIWNGLTATTPVTARPPRRRVGAWLIIALALAGLGTGFAMYGGAIIRIATNKGDLVIETDDPNLEVTIKQNGAVITEKGKNRTFVLTAGVGEVEFHDPESGVRTVTKEFRIERAGKTVVSAKMAELFPPKPPVTEKKLWWWLTPTGDVSPAARKPLEWVLANGGDLSLIAPSGEVPSLRATKKLPAGPFQVKTLWLNNLPKVNDDAIANLAGIPPVEHVDLSGTAVGDRGLTRLRTEPGFANVRILLLRDTAIGDTGLSQLRGLPLQELRIHECPHVTMKGIAHLTEISTLHTLSMDTVPIRVDEFPVLLQFKKLEHLGIGVNGIADTVVETLLKMPHLHTISVYKTKFSNAALARLKDHPSLEVLNLEETQVNDDGLAALRDFPKLASVILRNNAITDDAIPHLLACRHPNFSVDLTGTKVTESGIKKLAEKRFWRINWDRGEIFGWQVTPEMKEARAALEWVLNKGGYCSIVIEGTSDVIYIESGESLPTKRFLVHGLSFPPIPLTKIEFENVRGLPFISHTIGFRDSPISAGTLADIVRQPWLAAGASHFSLFGTKVGDSDLAEIPKIPRLTSLDLSHVPCTDAGLVHLRGMNLSCLHLWGNNKVTDAGMVHIATLTELTDMWLAATSVTDNGFPKLRGLSQMEHLEISRLPLTDRCVDTLLPMSNLLSLGIAYTRLTNDGLAQLKALPTLTHLNVGGSRVSDVGLVRLREFPALQNLTLRESGIRITDAGLAHLAACPGLWHLNVQKTAVTVEGIKKLSAALPYCRIYSDHGTFGPGAKAVEVFDPETGAKAGLQTFPMERGDTATMPELAGELLPAAPMTGVVKPTLPVIPFNQVAEREAAEWVLRVGGRVEVVKLDTNGTKQNVTKSSDLPVNFAIAGIWITCKSTMKASDVEKHLGLLSRVRDIDLRDWTLEDAGTRELSRLPSLRRLQISGIEKGVSDDGVRALATNPSIEDLCIGSGRLTKAGLDHLKSLPNLVALHLWHVKIADDWFAVLGTMKTLEKLTIGWVPLSTRLTAEGLTPLRNLTRLQIFWLMWANPRVEGDGLQTLVGMPALKGLSMPCVIRDDASLAQAKSFPALRELHIGGARITDDGMTHLEACIDLELLWLDGASLVGDVGVERLARLPKLRHVDLNNSRVGDQGAKALAKVPTLRFLSLNGTLISDEGAQALIGLPKLTELNLRQTKVSAATIKKLSAALPKCRISSDHGTFGPGVGGSP